MKLHLRSIVLTAGLSALLGSFSLSAQNSQEVANIPFAYSVGQKTLPAGKYTIQERGAGGLFRLLESASGRSIFALSTPVDTGRKDSKLVFGCYAGECSLSQIWMQGNVYSLTAKPLPREAKNQIGVVAMVSVPLLSR